MESIWRETVKMPEFPAMQGDTETDVLIIGGGMTGILCAYELQKAGVPYLLVEADTLAGGVTGCTTAKITVQHGLVYGELLSRLGKDKAKAYLDANLEALAAYRKLCEKIDCDFAEEPSFVYSLNDREKMQEEAEALQRLGFPAQVRESVSLPFPVAGAVECPGQAQFHPLKFLSAISRDLQIYEHTRVLELKATTAVTARGKITAKKIIIATHFPVLNKHGMYFLKMYQHRSYVIALKGAQRVEGMLVDEAQNGLSFRNYGDLLLLGGGSHRTGKQGGGWRELREVAAKYYPAAKEVCHWATQDCETLDKLPYIGPYSRNTDNLFVATGFRKWGMTTSVAAARLLRDQIIGTENRYASLFSPSRSMLHPQLSINGAESLVNLLTPTKPRCPHLGCALKWNSQERSWDCPCHGSRFSENGKLLDGPATGDLP